MKNGITKVALYCRALQKLAINLIAPQSAQLLRSLLRRDIPLGLGHQLVAHQELPHGSAPQQRRVEMQVQI